VVKIIFTPISIALGLVAGFISKKVFDVIWSQFTDEEAPQGAHRDIQWTKLLLAAALQGAIFRAMKETADRGSRKAFANLTGTWPGEKKPDAT
jgi:hypothetical protein